MKKFWIGFAPLLLLTISRISTALRLTKTAIPLYAVLNRPTFLQCRFELDENEALYSLKWFKDGNEFFRYKPSDDPKPITLFPLSGVFVNESQSSLFKEDELYLNTVHLETISFMSKGYYRCEISLEAPTFQTLEEEHYMDIMVLPSSGPKIKGIHSWYYLGQNFIANCSIENTYPEPNLVWSINDVEIDKEKCDCIFEEDKRNSKALDGRILVSKQSRLHFHLGSHYFRDGSIYIECKTLYSNSTVELKDIVQTKVRSSFEGHRYADFMSNGYIKRLSPILFYNFLFLLIFFFGVYPSLI